mmetsp:Transcript_20527/g.61791  ORF Transcript_20527/g.61791 Transcript_20527/m.61791 type:complete len:278 (-) Transcript_20527:216-1049(-)
MRVAHTVPPPRSKPQVHQPQFFLSGAAGLPKQKVLRFHVSVHIPLCVQLFQDGQGLHGDAGHHLLRHHLPLGVPYVPQARPQHIHHHDVVVPLATLVMHPRNAVNASERLVDRPFVWRTVITALAAPVLKLQRHIVGVGSLLVPSGHCSPADIDLPKAALPELPLEDEDWRAAHLALLRKRSGAGLVFFHFLLHWEILVGFALLLSPHICCRRLHIGRIRQDRLCCRWLRCSGPFGASSCRLAAPTSTSSWFLVALIFFRSTLTPQLGHLGGAGNHV